MIRKEKDWGEGGLYNCGRGRKGKLAWLPLSVYQTHLLDEYGTACMDLPIAFEMKKLIAL